MRMEMKSNSYVFMAVGDQKKFQLFRRGFVRLKAALNGSAPGRNVADFAKSET